MAASGAVADSRRDAGDSRLWCPVIPGPPLPPSPGHIPPPAQPSFLQSLIPARRPGRMPAGRGAQSRGKYSNRSRCAVRINIISHRERFERAMPGSGFLYLAWAPRAAHARMHARNIAAALKYFGGCEYRLRATPSSNIVYTFRVVDATDGVAVGRLANYAPHRASCAALVPH